MKLSGSVMAIIGPSSKCRLIFENRHTYLTVVLVYEDFDSVGLVLGATMNDY